MLKRSQSLLAYHLQAAANSLNLFCRKPIATMMTVIVIAIALALPTLFWVFTDNLSELTNRWQRGGHISLFLKPSLPEAEQTSLLEKVRTTEGVGQANIKSAADGLSELTQQEGMQDIMRYLPENPLPAVIEVVPALVIDSPAKLDLLSRKLQAFPQVALAKLDMEWINRLHAILGFSGKAANALMALLALAVVFIIGNTLRLDIHNRQEEIKILKLIGATDPYIIRPFLYSGIWYGAAGALLAIFLVNIFILTLGVAVNQLANVYQMHYPLACLSLRQILLLVLFAIILGWLGALLSVKRQLASIEPYK
ncbi:TPA: FtsX-like permease family protein [Legionella pneumophila]|uniref:Cell division protein FtsX n=2 Tax=Legionella pneumophila TaxID=446 RepID=Q5ZS51_LEGPH|nr:permease-like cell division protein FtsX [Legionella pneumophila]AAU28726.1 cell division ATP transporter FtsX [Legionella pneumophila subsp. pneumophila str. Philadelphia 1]AEW52903.1 cell division ATP transporter FtsX [Legionella pneumophila subsp. pneumophila ATCC 43290]AGH52453.1 Cell division protein FtsX [Legionella pneumophila subsp. pneumophila LPE509]AGN15589.1 cell division ATP transporter FtsX [Legionella pneumophila subsp. pneumophila str. Thunder Bay]AOU05661.1 cell division pr